MRKKYIVRLSKEEKDYAREILNGKKQQKDIENGQASYCWRTKPSESR
jgi:hypothetical protein